MSSATCFLHLESPSVATCEDCKCGLCSDCRQQALGRSFCAECLETRLDSGPAPAASAATGEPLKRPWLATALSFFVPGLGQVYNGLVTRGLAQFGFVFFMGWMASMMEGVGWLFGILVVVSWVWQWLDARQSALDINRTGRLPDIEEARALGALPLPASVASPRPIGIVLIVLGAIALLSGVIEDAGRFLLPLAIIVAGAWLVWRTRSQRDALGD